MHDLLVNNNNNELYLHDHTNTYSIQKLCLRIEITIQGNYVTLILVLTEYLADGTPKGRRY